LQNCRHELRFSGFIKGAPDFIAESAIVEQSNERDDELRWALKQVIEVS
jgi:hypothetical protein